MDNDTRNSLKSSCQIRPAHDNRVLSGQHQLRCMNGTHWKENQRKRKTVDNFNLIRHLFQQLSTVTVFNLFVPVRLYQKLRKFAWKLMNKLSILLIWCYLKECLCRHSSTPIFNGAGRGRKTSFVGRHFCLLQHRKGSRQIWRMKRENECAAFYRVCSRRPCWRSQTINHICIRIKFISQRKIILLFRSSNMAAVNVLYFNFNMSCYKSNR